jgi:hypothetical protein
MIGIEQQTGLPVEFLPSLRPSFVQVGYFADGLTIVLGKEAKGQGKQKNECIFYHDS